MYKSLKTSSREEWLKSREGHLTATQIARLITGGAAVWEEIRREVKGIRDPFSTRYTRWGQKRESVIADYVKQFVDSRLVPNRDFLISEHDPRIGATPDMIDGSNPCEVIGELKTSKHEMPELSPDLKGAYARYWWQVQTQLLVTGAEACVFAWEQHDDDWPEPYPVDITHQVVKPHTESVDRIYDVVDRFFSDEPEDEDVARLVEEYRREASVKKSAETRMNEIRDELQGLIPVGGSAVHGGVSVSHFQTEQRTRFDSKALKENDPDTWEKYVLTTAAKPQLRVTLPKED